MPHTISNVTTLHYLSQAVIMLLLLNIRKHTDRPILSLTSSNIKFTTFSSFYAIATTLKIIIFLNHANSKPITVLKPVRISQIMHRAAYTALSVKIPYLAFVVWKIYIERPIQPFSWLMMRFFRDFQRFGSSRNWSILIIFLAVFSVLLTIRFLRIRKGILTSDAAFYNFLVI